LKRNNQLCELWRRRWMTAFMRIQKAVLSFRGLIYISADKRTAERVVINQFMVGTERIQPSIH
jgi:hypothetical protein